MDLKPSKDKVYRKVERNADNHKHVKGSTTIIHKIRVELGLTLREYVLLDFICQWHSKKNKSITYGDFWEATGVYPRFIDGIFQRLKEKGLLFKDTDGMVKTTPLWNDNFNSSELFEELWKMSKVGNKQKAKSAFDKALKVDSYDNIKAGFLKYKEFLKQTEQFEQHLSTFLSAKNKEWTTEFDASNYKKKTTASDTPKVSTGPQSKWK